jgi:DNA-binding protein HU-beta
MPLEKKHALANEESQSTITLKQMAAELADGYNVPKKQAEDMLDDLMALAIRHLKNGHKIRLTGLCLLQIQRPPTQTGVNLQTGEVIVIKGRGKIAFRAAKELMEAI